MLGFIKDCLQNIWRFFSGMDSMPVVMGSAGFQPGGLLMATVTSKTTAWHHVGNQVATCPVAGRRGSGGGVRNRAIPALRLNSTSQNLRHQPYIVL